MKNIAAQLQIFFFVFSSRMGASKLNGQFALHENKKSDRLRANHLRTIE